MRVGVKVTDTVMLRVRVLVCVSVDVSEAPDEWVCVAMGELELVSLMVGVSVSLDEGVPELEAVCDGDCEDVELPEPVCELVVFWVMVTEGDAPSLIVDEGLLEMDEDTVLVKVPVGVAVPVWVPVWVYVSEAVGVGAAVEETEPV